MSRRTKTKLPITEEQLQPQPKETRVVKERLQHYREQQVKYYNRTAKKLQPLNVVRVQSKDGFIKKGVVVREAKHPRSHKIESGNREYRRSHRQIIKVDEPPEFIEIEEPEETQQTQREEISERENSQEDQDVPDEAIKKTRSGRVVRPPNRLNL